MCLHKVHDRIASALYGLHDVIACTFVWSDYCCWLVTYALYEVHDVIA